MEMEKDTVEGNWEELKKKGFVYSEEIKGPGVSGNYEDCH